MENKKKKNSIPFTGLGLVFGTALGAATCAILSIPILWAGIGTAAGLIVGAVADSQKSCK
jgi:uncharacterized membrane protein